MLYPNIPRWTLLIWVIVIAMAVFELFGDDTELVGEIEAEYDDAQAAKRGTPQEQGPPGGDMLLEKAPVHEIAPTTNGRHGRSYDGHTGNGNGHGLGMPCKATADCKSKTKYCDNTRVCSDCKACENDHDSLDGNCLAFCGNKPKGFENGVDGSQDQNEGHNSIDPEPEPGRGASGSLSLAELEAKRANAPGRKKWAPWSNRVAKAWYVLVSSLPKI